MKTRLARNFQLSTAAPPAMLIILACRPTTARPQLWDMLHVWRAAARDRSHESAAAFDEARAARDARPACSSVLGLSDRLAPFKKGAGCLHHAAPQQSPPSRLGDPAVARAEPLIVGQQFVVSGATVAGPRSRRS